MCVSVSMGELDKRLRKFSEATVAPMGATWVGGEDPELRAWQGGCLEWFPVDQPQVPCTGGEVASLHRWPRRSPGEPILA